MGNYARSDLMVNLAISQAFVASRVAAALTDEDRARLARLRDDTTDPSLQARIDELLAD